jgi:hypothetical protein
MGADFTTVDEILQDDYGPLVEQLNNRTIMLAQFEQDVESIDTTGRRAFLAIHTGRSAAVGNRSERQQFPTPRSQKYKNPLIPLRKTTYTFDFSVELQAAAGRPGASFGNAIDREMTGILDDTAKDRERQVCGTSNGVIATCGVTAASTTVVLASTTTRTQMKQLYREGGMRVDIGTVANPISEAQDREVESVDYANKTIEISGAAVDSAGTDFVFRTGNGGDSDASGQIDDGQFELTGIQTAIDDSDTLHGLTVAAVPSWSSFVDDNGGTLRAYSEQIVADAILEADEDVDFQVDRIWANRRLYTTIASSYRAERRAIDRVSIKAGFTGIRFSTPTAGLAEMDEERVIAFGDEVPENKLFGMAMASWRRFVGAESQWMQNGSSVLQPVNDGTYIGRGFIIDEIGCVNRRANFRIDDLMQG